MNYFNQYEIILMFGFQNYPTAYKNINLNRIRRLMHLFPNREFGYADHTAWDEPNNILITLLGASLGMNYIEKHVTSTFGVKRIDWEAAISFNMINEIGEGINVLEACNSDGSLVFNKGEMSYAKPGFMKKIPIFRSSVKRNQKFSLDMIDFKRTGQSSDMDRVEVLNAVGKTFTNDIEKNTALKRDDLI